MEELRQRQQWLGNGEARVGRGAPGSKGKQFWIVGYLLGPQGQLPSGTVREEDP